jgi:formylglycine-generating enzyme required for sulfatase activity
MKSLRTGRSLTERMEFDELVFDECEVSNKDFKEFVDATGHPAPYGWSPSGYDPALDELPVVTVSHADALAFALWKGKRLPTIAEWMAAAQAPDGRRHPWGTADPPEWVIPSPEALRERQIVTEGGAVEVYRKRARKIRDGEGTRSPIGLYHMYGNVGEWLGTLHTIEAPGGATTAVVVGVARTDWMCDPALTDLSDTSGYPMGQGSARVGFRCVRSLRPTIEGE